MGPLNSGCRSHFGHLCAKVIIILLILLEAGKTQARTCRSAGGATSIEFDPQEMMCCSGVLHTIRQDIQPYVCCGQALYNSATHDCCAGQILDRTSNPRLKCCPPPFRSGGLERVYNSDEQICCQGTLADKTEGSECCGNTAMDSTTHTCCYDGTTHSPREGLGKCCGWDKLYNATSEICCEKMTGQDHMSRVHHVGGDAIIDQEFECCGLAAIRTRDQQCCLEVPKDKTPYTECCGQRTYDLRSEVCCTGTVSNRTEGRTECCDIFPFNPDNEVCCGFGTTRYPTGHGSCCRRDPYSPVLASCCNGNKQPIPDILGVQACCSGQAYLKTDHLCCQGQLSERQPNMECCGNGVYNTSAELCCQGFKHQRPQPSLQCCGTSSYDTETETCCPKTGLNFPGRALSCCHADIGTVTQVFDPASQTCCKSRRNVGVYWEPQAGERCCGHSLLQDNQLCDMATRQPVNKSQPDHDAVCRPVNRRTGRPLRGSMPMTYNSDNQVCSVAGDLWMRLPGEDICGQSIYQPDSQLCCSGQIHGIQDQYGNPQECCGNTIHKYTPSLQSCFAGRVFNIPKELAGVCRNRIFNTNTSACDRYGKVRPYSEVANLPEICIHGPSVNTWTPYNPRENDCCGDDLIGQGQTCCNGLTYDTPGTAVGAGRCCRQGGGYNPDTHTCCNGRLFPTNEGDMECCGGRPFEPTDQTQICCGNRLHSVQDGRTVCTDGTVHSPQETVCDGVLYGVAHGSCCGKNIMDDTKICCQGFIYSKEDHGTECCGKVAYNPSAQGRPICCGDTLHHVAQGLQCCGSQVIDPAQRQCCGAEGHRFAFRRDTGQTCCGEVDGDYDPLRHTCCHGLLHRFLVGGECCGHDAVRDPTKEVCCGGVVQAKRYKEDTLCCNGYILDGRRFSCCGNLTLQRQTNLQQGCCNGVVFDRNHKECVGDMVQDRVSEDATVSDRRMLPRQTEHAPRLTRDATDTMNQDIEQTTNLDGQTTSTEKRSLTEGTSARAEVEWLTQDVTDTMHQDIEETTDMDEQKTSMEERSLTEGISTTNITANPLCGAVEYDRFLEGCCDERLYNLSVGSCVNGSILITTKFQDQPGGRQSSTVTASTTSHTDPTGLPVTEEPCSVIRARENASEELACCGSLLYDPENATCCQGMTDDGEGTVMVWSAVTDGVTNGSCCYETAYNPQDALCCNKEVFMKDGIIPDMLSGCCPNGYFWNRVREACEESPTISTFMMDETSGMSPDDF